MRTSLLINCSQREAGEVRIRARLERRTVSAYVLNVVLRSIGLSEKVISGLGSFPQFKLARGTQVKGSRPRTTLHIHCSKSEAKQIRSAAEFREITISGFVLGCLRRSWEVADSLDKRYPKLRF